MAKWSADDIPDLNGQIFVVTGANSGIGFEASIELARHGGHVVLACRNEQRGRDAVERIRAEVPTATLELSLLDLSNLESVRGFADDFLARHDGLDVLINNAGVMALPERRTTAEGFEMQFGTNHLGHFALTGLLLPALLARSSARVVSITSGAHRLGWINFGDLQAERRYRKWLAYCQSKLANVLFGFELDRRARDAGSDLISIVAHPGFAHTNLQDGTSFGPARVLAQSPAMGALPTLYAATAPDVKGGEFFGPDGFMEQRGNPTRVTAVRAGRDPEKAQRLWEISEELTGVSYEFEPAGAKRGP